MEEGCTVCEELQCDGTVRRYLPTQKRFMQEEVPDFFSEVSMNGKIKKQSFQDFLESSMSSNYVKFQNMVMNLQRCCKTLQKDITSSVLAHFIK